MKSKLLIATAFAAAFSAPVYAAQFDISAITCEEAATLTPEELVLVLAFIDGFTGGEAGDPVLDTERLGGDIDQASAACAADPAMTVMDAMKAALAE